MPGAGNRGGSLAGVFRPLITGPSGSAVSPRLSGWTARPGICRPSPLPTQGQALHRRPALQAQIASGLLSRPAPDSLAGVEVRAVARRFTSLSSSSGVLRYSRTASPRWAGALSQMTRSGPGCFSFSFVRKATEVPLLLLPSSSIHSTSPVSGTPLNSSWPSPHTAGWSSPPEPGSLSSPTCPAVRRPPGSGPRRQRISCRQSAPPRPTGHRTPPRRTPVWPRPP